MYGRTRISVASQSVLLLSQASDFHVRCNHRGVITDVCALQCCGSCRQPQGKWGRRTGCQKVLGQECPAGLSCLRAGKQKLFYSTAITFHCMSTSSGCLVSGAYQRPASATTCPLIILTCYGCAGYQRSAVGVMVMRAGTVAMQAALAIRFGAHRSHVPERTQHKYMK